MNDFPSVAAFGAEYCEGVTLEDLSWDELKRFANIALFSDYIMAVNRDEAAMLGTEPWVTRQEANALATRIVDENASAG